MKAIAVDRGDGAVLPSVETVEQAQDRPLARPLFILREFGLSRSR